VGGRPTGPTRPQHACGRGTHDRTGADSGLSNRLVEVDEATADRRCLPLDIGGQDKREHIADSKVFVDDHIDDPVLPGHRQGAG
jgi:hypothetical protein